MASDSVVSIPTLTAPVLGQYFTYKFVLEGSMLTEWNRGSREDIPSIVRCPWHCTLRTYKKIDILGPVGNGSGHRNCSHWSWQACYHESFQRHARHVGKCFAIRECGLETMLCTYRLYILPPSHLLRTATPHGGQCSRQCSHRGDGEASESARFVAFQVWRAGGRCRDIDRLWVGCGGGAECSCNIRDSLKNTWWM